jgi:hypothetical protein
MKLKPGLTRTKKLDVESTRRQAERAGYTTFVLPAKGITDRVSFFDAVRATLPLDPPVVGSHSWDALSDSLWEGLYALSNQRVAVLWPNASAMAQGDRSAFETALSVFSDVITSLTDPRATRGKPKEVALVVE